MKIITPPRRRPRPPDAALAGLARLIAAVLIARRRVHSATPDVLGPLDAERLAAVDDLAAEAADTVTGGSDDGSL